MTTFAKLTTMTAFAALLGTGLALAPQQAYADKGGSLDYPRFNPYYMKGIGSKGSGASASITQQSMSADAKDSGKRGLLNYPRLDSNYLKGIGSN